MQHKRQEMESVPFPEDRGYSKRRKIELSPTDSGFGESYNSDLEQDYKLWNCPSYDPESLASLTDGTELLEEHGQRDLKYYRRESTDSESLGYLSDGIDGKELLEEHDSESLIYGTNSSEPLEEHGEHDSENAYRELTDPNSPSDISDSTEGSKFLDEHGEHDSEYSYLPTSPSSNSGPLPGVFDETEDPEFFEKNMQYDYGYSSPESTDSESSSDESDETNGEVELREQKKLNSKYSERESTESFDSPKESERIKESELLRIRLCPNMSLNEYLWQPRFNDDSSFKNDNVMEEETEQQQLKRAIRNSLIENVPDKRRKVSRRVEGEVKRERRRSRKVHFEENEMDPSTRISEFRLKEDFIFPQFNVTGDIRTLHPEMFAESSEELSKEGHHFIASLLRNMSTPKGRVGPKIDDEVKNLVLDIKEKMKGDKHLQINWLAACLLQLYTDLHGQLEGVLQFSKRTGSELDKLYDKMAGLAKEHLSSKETDSFLFREIIEYLDVLQTEVFLNQREVLKGHFKALVVLANEMKCFYQWRLAIRNSEEEYSRLSNLISYFCPLFVNLCDTAFHTVKKCKEFYRVRNYVLSRIRKN